jgi:hypothetical protein
MIKNILIHPEELNKKWIDRMADGGIKILGIHPHGGGKAVESLTNLLERLETKEYRELIDYAVSRGLEIEYEMHAARFLLPEALFDSHPEYFRMMANGERTKNLNFCVSNSEALDLVAKNAAELAKKLYKSRPVFYFWLDDARNAFCKCERCKKLTPSHQQLVASNAMLAEIRKEIPDAKFAYLAYQDTLEVPENVKPDEGIFLEYAPIEKYKNEAPERIVIERNMLLKQAEFFSWKDSKVLEYWLDNSLFSGWKKPPKEFIADDTAITKEVKEYADLGFDIISTFGCFLGEDYEELYGEADISAFTKA